jgi:hypothetical protein
VSRRPEAVQEQVAVGSHHDPRHAMVVAVANLILPLTSVQTTNNQSRAKTGAGSGVR